MDSTNIKTPKLNVSTIKSPLSGGGSDLGGVGQGGTSKVGTLAKIVRKNRIAINSLIKIQENKEKLPAEDINSSLVETNKILVAIQNQLALQSKNEQKEEKEDRRRESLAESKRKLKKEESALEKTAKGIGKAVGKVALKIVQPIGGIFDKILEFVTLLGAGIATNAAFEWFKNEENRKKLTKFFNILKENWQLLAKILGTLVIADLAIKLAGALLTLKSILLLVANPIFLAGVGVIMAAAMQGMGPQEKALIKELEDMGGVNDENRKKLIQNYKNYRQDYKSNPLKYPLITARNLTGEVDREIDERIRFLKTGEFDYGGKKIKFDFGFGNFITATQGGKFDYDTGEVESTSPDGSKPGIDLFRGKREMGGPVTAGQSYLVGEGGPEIFSPNINGSIVNNMRTEKIVQTLKSDMGEGNISMIELPPITNEMAPPEVPVPKGEATEVPNFPSANMADPYRILSPRIYGITV